MSDRDSTMYYSIQAPQASSRPVADIYRVAKECSQDQWEFCKQCINNLCTVHGNYLLILLSVDTICH